MHQAELRRGRVWRSEVQRAMWPMTVVVVDEGSEHAVEVALIEDQQPVEALGANGPDEALCDRISLRRPHGCLDDLDAFAGEHGVKVARELAVAVADQEPKRRRPLVKHPDELARLLRDPCAGRAGGAAGKVNAAAAELDEEKHVEPLQRDRLDSQEVDGEHALGLRPQEGTPGEPATPAGGANAGLSQNLPDCGRRYLQAEAVDLAGDPLVTPARVLPREPQHQLADLAIDRRAAVPTLVRPAASDEPLVPAQERRRGDEE